MASDGQCPGLEWDKGLAQFSGNEELYMSILGYYVSDMEPLLGRIKTVNESELAAYAEAAHAIKGASYSVFANSLGDAAEKLEHAAKDGDFAYVSAHYEAFFNEADKLVKDISTLLTAKGL